MGRPIVYILAGRITGSLMDELIAKLNIEHFKKKLDKETDEAIRKTLLTLLAEEEAKLPKITMEASKKASDEQ